MPIMTTAGNEMVTAPKMNVSGTGRELRYLSANEYSVWDDLVEASAQGSIFCHSWWLEAVGGDVRVLGYFEKGRLVAGIPLYFQKRWGLSICVMPKLTRTWGVVLEPLRGKRAAVAQRETDLLTVFATCLSQQKVFFQEFHASLQNWIPFHWKGFRQTTRLVYVLNRLNDLEEVWGHVDASVRNKVRKAEKLGVSIQPCSAAEVFRTVSASFERQSLELSYDQKYLAALYEAARQNHSGACRAAIDPEGRICAAAFMVWDRRKLYSVASGGVPELRNNGAQVLLQWDSIRFAAERGLAYDFQGSMVKSVEAAFRAYGGELLGQSWIMKFPLWLHSFLGMRGKI